MDGVRRYGKNRTRLIRGWVQRAEGLREVKRFECGESDKVGFS